MINMERIDLIAVKHEDLHAEIYLNDKGEYEVFIFGDYPNTTVNVSHPNKEEALDKAMTLFMGKNICMLKKLV